MPKAVPNASTQTKKLQLPDGETAVEDDTLKKTSFYPSQGQLEKLDDYATDYNKKYRRQRKKIDRQDIIRHLIEKLQPEDLDDLEI